MSGNTKSAVVQNVVAVLSMASGMHATSAVESIHTDADLSAPR
jgi:hypothetical protein